MEQVRREVAISGFTSSSQVNELSRVIDRRPSNTRVVFGFSTGFGIGPSSELARRPGLYVPMMECARLHGDAEVDYLAHFTPNLKGGFPASEQVRLLYSFIGSWLNGIQINDPLINSGELRRIAALDPYKELVYPLGRASARRIIFGGAATDYRLQQVLASGVTTLLLDNSAGQGDPLSYGEISVCLEELWRVTDASMRVAGRLGRTRDDLEVVRRLLDDFPNQSFGWEVESRLRSVDDRFSTKAARSYLEESFELIWQRS